MPINLWSGERVWNLHRPCYVSGYYVWNKIWTPRYTTFHFYGNNEYTLSSSNRSQIAVEIHSSSSRTLSYEMLIPNWWNCWMSFLLRVTWYTEANIHWDGWFSLQRVPRFYIHFGGSFLHIVKKKLASGEASLWVTSVLIFQIGTIEYKWLETWRQWVFLALWRETTREFEVIMGEDVLSDYGSCLSEYCNIFCEVPLLEGFSQHVLHPFFKHNDYHHAVPEPQETSPAG